jgi:ankyrin repeat protein
MQKQFLAIITACLVLTGCMSSEKYEDLSYGNCTFLCYQDWWRTASNTDLKDIIRSGADVNGRDKGGSTPLHFAASYGTPAHIKTLLNAGASLHARIPPNGYDWLSTGETPLHIAALGKRANVKALIEAGADVNASAKDGDTPLHKAIFSVTLHAENPSATDSFSKTSKAEAVDKVQTLIKAGADVNKQNKRGETPLHDAAEGSSVTAVRILLNAGANPNIRNRDSKNALLAARKETKNEPDWPEVANMLKAAGSETNLNAASIACSATKWWLGRQACIDSY